MYRDVCQRIFTLPSLRKRGRFFRETTSVGIEMKLRRDKISSRFPTRVKCAAFITGLGANSTEKSPALISAEERFGRRTPILAVLVARDTGRLSDCKGYWQFPRRRTASIDALIAFIEITKFIDSTIAVTCYIRRAACLFAADTSTAINIYD